MSAVRRCTPGRHWESGPLERPSLLAWSGWPGGGYGTPRRVTSRPPRGLSISARPGSTAAHAG